LTAEGAACVRKADTGASMSENTLISADRLLARGDSAGAWVVLDCSFDLADPQGGERLYLAGHIPGAQYVHLDRDLAAPQPAGPRTSTYPGRHPLPERADFARRVGTWGIGPQTQVVVYDRAGGMVAARAWWMLRWLGHSAVAVLDGGLAAWQAAGGELQQTIDPVSPLPPYPATEHGGMAVIDANGLMSQLGRVKLLDARSMERWRGIGETLDPVGGHIPGSLPRFFKDNLQPDGRFKPAEVLRQEFVRLGAGLPDAPLVHSCGSGVTACHNILAMAHGGLSAGALYPGSWSEWCAEPARPVAVG
jgi:thiosulfate/3-mercaptopyruvate sulfurtransferase